LRGTIVRSGCDANGWPVSASIRGISRRSDGFGCPVAFVGPRRRVCSRRCSRGTRHCGRVMKQHRLGVAVALVIFAIVFAALWFTGR
jgi:hypothetical protein